jgi:hypothetical protein
MRSSCFLPAEQLQRPFPQRGDVIIPAAVAQPPVDRLQKTNLADG